MYFDHESHIYKTLDLIHFMSFDGVIDGSFVLTDMPYKIHLPTLKVTKNLIVRHSKFVSISEGTEVGGFMDIRQCNLIKTLPSNLKVGSNIYAHGSGLRDDTIPQINMKEWFVI